eukprot:2801736-Amphidinium_carterae.1
MARGIGAFVRHSHGRVLKIAGRANLGGRSTGFGYMQEGRGSRRTSAIWPVDSQKRPAICAEGVRPAGAELAESW